MKIGRVAPDLRPAIRRYARRWRWTGLGLLVVGAIMVVWPRVTGEWPMIGSLPLQRLGFILVAAAWIILVAVIVRRTRYYRQLLAERDAG